MKKHRHEAKPKHVKVSHKHTKPYRKRHVIAFVAFAALGIALINSVLLYARDSDVARRVAAQTISDAFGRDQSNSSTIESTYGFKLAYNTKQYYPSAIDGSSGELYVGPEVQTGRAYDTIRLSKQNVEAEGESSIKLAYYPNDKPASTDLSAIEKTYITDRQTNPKELTKVGSSQQTYGGVTFLRSEWSRTLRTGSVSLKTTFVTYSAVLGGKPLTVIVYQGFGDNATDSIMKGFSATTKQVAANLPSLSVQAKKDISLRLIDSAAVSQAGAAAPTYAQSEKISAEYGPAVVKIYNVEVGDLAIDGQVVLPKYVTGGTGSGFIVSQDGYVATNGHVAVISARDEVVSYAIEEAQYGNSKPLLSLIALSGATDTDIAGASSAKEAIKILIKKIYDMPESRFTFQNAKQNLLVGLADEQVDLTDLVKKTTDGQAYAQHGSIRTATLKRSDFDGIVLPAYTGEFSKSDVALIKIEGTNYPMVKLGDMSDLAQGGNLNIMGFPGIGSDNGIVSQTKTSSTLTTGKVSSHKTDSGGHQLVETDTEIGHGNSGGPAFNDDGEVIGIATYSVAGDQGDGTLNYIRDIKDLKKIATSAAVGYGTSATQTEWDKGVGLFYDAHYKSAVKRFAQVKQLYPSHPTAAQMIATAQKRIANGENIDEFPTLLVVILGLIILAGAAGSVVFIVIHKRKHNALVQAVATGQAQPPAFGAPAQFVPPAMPTQQFIAQAPQLAQVAPAYAAPAPIAPQPAYSTAQPVQNPITASPQPVQVQAPQPTDAFPQPYMPQQQPQPQQPPVTNVQPPQQPDTTPQNPFQTL